MDATLLYANGYMKQNTYTTGALSNTSSRIVDYEPTCLYDNTVMSLDITDDMEADGYSYEKQGGSYAAAPFFEGDCKLYVKHWDGIKNDYIAIAWDEIYADTVFGLLVIMWCGATEAVNVIFAKEVLEYAVEAKDFLDAFTGKNTFYQYEHYNAIEMCRGVVFDVCVQETVYRNDEYRVINAGNEKEEKVFSKDGVYYQNNAEDFMDYCLGRYYNDYHFPLYVNENCNRMCEICGGTGHKTSHPSYTTATCTSASVCTQCGYENSPELGHNYSEATCTEVSTCYRCGRTTGTALGHDYTDATCTSSQYCLKCGDVLSGPIAHDYTYATCTEPEKCRECGSIGNTELGHNYSPATCTEPEKCGRCDAIGDPALGHDYSPATCTEPRTCSRCNRTSGSALGHEYAAATCTEPKACTRCNKTSGSALEHNYGTQWSYLNSSYHVEYCTRSGCNQAYKQAHTSSSTFCTKCGYGGSIILKDIKRLETEGIWQTEEILLYEH